MDAQSSKEDYEPDHEAGYYVYRAEGDDGNEGYAGGGDVPNDAGGDDSGDDDGDDEGDDEGDDDGGDDNPSQDIYIKLNQ